MVALSSVHLLAFLLLLIRCSVQQEARVYCLKSPHLRQICLEIANFLEHDQMILKSDVAILKQNICL